MPIFMDRHDMRDMTAESIAEAHRQDLEIQDKYGVKYMTYWFDRERGTDFAWSMRPTPLPPSGSTARLMARSRQTSSRSTSRRSKRFSAASAIPMAAPGAAAREVDAGLRAVMFTDIVGSTEMTMRLGDAAALELVRVHDALVRRGLAANQGARSSIPAMGSWLFLTTWPSAVRAAGDIQWHFWLYNLNASRESERADRHPRRRALGRAQRSFRCHRAPRLPAVRGSRGRRDRRVGAGA